MYNANFSTASLAWPNTSSNNFTDFNEFVSPSDTVLRLLNFVTVLLLIIIILSAGGHIVVIICIYKDKTLRTIFNCYVVALSLADCLIALIAAPIHLGQTMAKGPTHETWCKIKTAVATFSVMYSLLSMAVIASIRVQSVVKPFKRLRTWVVYLAIFIQTVVSSVATGLVLNNHSVMFPCRMTYLLKKKDTIYNFYHLFHKERSETEHAKTWLLVFIAAVMSFVVSIAFYTVIFCSLRSRSSIGIPPTDTNNSETTQGVAGAAHNTTTVLTASTAIQKTDILTLKTALILTTMFFVNYTPSFFLGFTTSSGYLYPFVTALMYFHSAMNPIIYFWSSGKFRASFSKLLSNNCRHPHNG